MEPSMENDREESVLRTLLVPSALMLLVYLAAIGGAGFLLHIVVKSGLMPHRIYGFWIQNLDFALQALAGLLAIRVMGGSRSEHGLTLPVERSYIPHALILGAAAAAIQTVILFLPALLRGHQEYFALTPGLPAGSPEIPGMGEQALIAGVGGIVQAFLLFGVMQVYLMRKTAAHVRLGLWDVPVAGIAVCLIAVLYVLIPWIRQPWIGLPFVVMALAPAVFYGIVLLASACWFERSRSLVAPVIALGVYYGAHPFLYHVIYVSLR